MADNLIFPIGFDLDEAVKKAGDQWDSKYADALEKRIQKRALAVKLKIDISKLDSLDAVKERLAKLKIEPITPETRTAIKDLARELQILAKALEQVQKYSTRAGGTPEAVRNSRIALNEERAKAQAALAAQRTARAEYNLAAARDKAARAAERGAAATRNANREFHNQDGYVSRLVKRLAVYASFSAVNNFLTSVREVTAQFELQRVSLGAIIQDQTRANALFSEIKQFALKSPVSILDLTKYTKQLAAYKIGVDELFETTKKLTDVSVGLGVSLDRVILAYGQVRARGALYSSEIRQFTEMGVPIVEELAAKLSKANGELVTSAQVLKMVEKGAISFELVKEVFDDMTSAGGMFYNMQEKQGNTLFGLWAKLGDAASMMYDEIGNTEGVNSGIRAGIEALTDLMRNWERTARAMGAIGLVIAGLVVRKKILALEIAKVDAIQRTYNARMVKANALAASNSRLVRAQGVAMGVYATTMRTASTAAAAFGTSLRAIKSALVTTGWGALIVALGYLVDKLFLTKTAADEVKEALGKVYEETAVEQDKSTRNFEYLAKLATDASKGYKERQEALEELQRTYKDILPSEVLEIGYLTKLKGNYDSLTNSIRAYVAEQQRRKAIDEISSVYGTEKQKYEGQLTGFFREEGWSEQEIARFWEYFYKVAADKSKSLEQVVREAAEKGGRDGLATVEKLLQHQDWMGEVDKAVYNKTGLSLFGSWLGGGVDNIDLLRDVVLQENLALEQNEERMKAAGAAASRFADAYAKSAERIANTNLFHASGERIDRDSYLGEQMLNNKKVIGLADILKAEFERVGVEWDKGFGNLIRKVNEGKPELISSLDFTAILDSLAERLNDPKLTDAQRKMIVDLISFAREAQQKYWEIVPQDPVVRTWRQRFRQIAQSMGGFRQEYNQYLMKAGEDLEAYNKRLKDSLEGLKNKVKGLLAVQKLVVKAGIFAKLRYGVSADELQAEIDKENNKFKIIEKELADQPNFDDSNGRTESDSRLQILNEMVQLAEKLNKEYSDWEKKVGGTKALEKVNDTYKETVKYAERVAKAAGIKLPHLETPTNAKELNEYLDAVRRVMETAKGLKGGKKAAIELNVKMSDNISAESQKAIEEKIKALADRISRTKTAREFYDKVLGMTGDYDLASKVSMSIYGSAGFGLQKQLAAQIRQYFKNDNVTIEIPVDIITSDNQINYKKLGEFADKYKEALGEKSYEAVKKIAEQGQKDLAKTYEGYLKGLEKAKNYSDKRIELAETTAKKIRQIRADMASGNTDKSVGESLISGLVDKEMIEAAKLEWEAFKGTPLYVQIFDDLEHASTSTLEMMRSRIEALGRTWGSALDPTQLKEMQSRMNEITDQLRERNPWEQLREAYTQYKEATDSVSFMGAVNKVGEASKNLYDASAIYGPDSIQAKAAEQELKAREKIVDIVKEITTEQGKQVKGQKALILAQQKAADMQQRARGKLELETAALKAAEDKAITEGKDPAKDPGVIAAREKVAAAKEEVELTKKVSEITTNNLQSAKTWKESLVSAAYKVEGVGTAMSDIAAGIAKVTEAMGGSEEDVQYWNDISTAIGEITGGLGNLVEHILSLDIGATISDVIGIIPNMISGFVGLFSAGKVRKANKEIKRQQELLNDLEHTYSRLEKAAEKVFGGDFINNFELQRKNLEAQAKAYKAMAAAERSKGKKADEAKAQEYDNSYRETMDEIADMQGQIAAQMLGADLTSAARDFAQAWIEAYKVFGNTAGKMSEKFHEMVENMVVESVLAKVMERALKPMFDMIDGMGDQDFYSETFWRQVVAEAERGAKNADAGARTMMSFLEQAGVTVRGLGGDLSGITREIAGASEETMSGVAAALNTQNYYVSHVPVISEHVAAIRMLMEGGEAQPRQGGVDTTALWTQHLELQQGIYRHTAETVAQCERIASQCESIASDLRRVTGSVPSEGTGIRVWINGR